MDQVLSSAGSSAPADAPDGAATGTLAGWGRLAVPGREVVSEDFERVTRDLPLSRGLGRSYGDASLPPPGRLRVAGSRLADRLLSFDDRTGVLRAEAGLSLGELSRVFWPRRWASPVYTGTQYVTLGGMVAADVHGKNHHVAGSFGDHVRRLRMCLPDGRVLWCSPTEAEDLFRATIGGMGLTGHVLEVELTLDRIPSPWIWGESERIPDLDHFLAALSDGAARWPFTVGWIDCLTQGRHMGRGILNRGRWATVEEAPSGPPPPKRRFTVPIEFPGWVLNRWSTRLFNFGYYWKHVPRLKRGILHPEAFFHPLDVLKAWNKVYGPRGFSQYQCVIPKAAGVDGVRRFFDVMTRIGVASFLSVMKDFGEGGRGLLSFPMPGTTINLDIPVRDDTQQTVDRLNECVLELGGRIYLAKDAFTRPEHFRAMEGERLEEWRQVRRRWDPEGRLGSAQSVRILGETP